MLFRSVIEIRPDLIKKVLPEEVTFEMRSKVSRKYSLLKGWHTKRSADARNLGQEKD